MVPLALDPHARVAVAVRVGLESLELVVAVDNRDAEKLRVLEAYEPKVNANARTPKAS